MQIYFVKMFLFIVLCMYAVENNYILQLRVPFYKRPNFIKLLLNFNKCFINKRQLRPNSTSSITVKLINRNHFIGIRIL